MDTYCQACVFLVKDGAVCDCLKGWPDRPCQERVKWNDKNVKEGYCLQCDEKAFLKGRKCLLCGYRNKRLSARLTSKPLVVMTTGYIETLEDVCPKCDCQVILLPYPPNPEVRAYLCDKCQIWMAFDLAVTKLVRLDLTLTGYCNGTCVDRIRYNGEDVKAHLVVHLTREKAALIEWQPLEDPEHWDPAAGGC